MSRPKSLILIPVLAVIVTVAILILVSGRARSGNQTRAAAAALLELQCQWSTNGNVVVFSRDRWPTSIKALQMNAVEVGRTTAGASKLHEAAFGIWWSEGYQIRRQSPDEAAWTLYRTHAFGFTRKKAFHWWRALTVVTNSV